MLNKYLENLRDYVANIHCKGHLLSEEQKEQAIDTIIEACEKAEKYDELTEIPTPEKITEEWKALGWKFRKIKYGFEVAKMLNNQYVQIFALKFKKEITILAQNVATKAPLFINLQEHQLITKTFKMLKWV